MTNYVQNRNYTFQTEEVIINWKDSTQQFSTIASLYPGKTKISMIGLAPVSAHNVQTEKIDRKSYMTEFGLIDCIAKLVIPRLSAISSDSDLRIVVHSFPILCFEMPNGLASKCLILGDDILISAGISVFAT